MDTKFLVPGIVLVFLVGGFFINAFFDSRGNARADTSDAAWATFEKYLGYARNHELKNLSKVSHQLGDTCKNPDTREECFEIMDQVADLGNRFRREDFTEVLQDKKQIVISSEWIGIEDETAKGYSRAALYFTRDFLGRPKLLAIFPDQIVYVLKDGLTDEETDEVLRQELAIHDKDTDGNGWWENVEALFHKRDIEPLEGFTYWPDMIDLPE